VECPAFFPVLIRETGQKEAEHGERKEAYIRTDRELLRQIEVAVANGKTTPVACGRMGSLSRRTIDGGRWLAGGPGAAAEGTGTGECEAEAAGIGTEPGELC
jgi:hypothetical protein